MEVTYEEAKEKICKHLRKLLNLLEKMKINLNDGWCDEITCTDCECAITLIDFEPWNFKKVGPSQHYPIRSIEFYGKTYAIKENQRDG